MPPERRVHEAFGTPRELESPKKTLQAIEVVSKATRRRLTANALFLSLVMGFPALAFAQDSTATVIRDLRAAYAAASRNVIDAAARAQLAQVGKSVSRLEGRWANAGGPTLSDDYLKALRYNTLLLQQSVLRPDSAESLLRDAATDLQAKAWYASNGMGITPAFQTEVTVTVRTRRAGQEVGGFLVRANAARYSGLGEAMYKFNQLTSPSMRTLPPGNYLIWIERNGIIVDRRQVTISGAGAEEIAFDIP